VSKFEYQSPYIFNLEVFGQRKHKWGNLNQDAFKHNSTQTCAKTDITYPDTAIVAILW